jgi:hypothetical protein
MEEAVGGTNSNSGILSDPVGTAGSIGQAIKHNVPMPEDAADILKTVGKLKGKFTRFVALFRVTDRSFLLRIALSPLYTYALYHPIRFLLRYLILPLPSLLLFLLLAILQILAYLVKSLFYPFYVAFHFITAPARIAFGFLHALMPVWIFLGSALFIGCCVGAVAGLLMGGTTKYAIEKTLDVAVWPLRVIGLVEPSKLQEKERKKKPEFGANGGARLEKIPERNSQKGVDKGKSKATDSRRVKEEELSTTDEEHQPFASNSWNGQRRMNHSMGSSSSSSSEEEDTIASSSIGVNGRRGRNSESRRNVKSGWRKRHVQDVLQ